MTIEIMIPDHLSREGAKPIPHRWHMLKAGSRSGFEVILAVMGSLFTLPLGINVPSVPSIPTAPFYARVSNKAGGIISLYKTTDTSWKKCAHVRICNIPIALL
jgi:hypothetical protein